MYKKMIKFKSISFLVIRKASILAYFCTVATDIKSRIPLHYWDYTCYWLMLLINIPLFWYTPMYHTYNTWRPLGRGEDAESKFSNSAFIQQSLRIFLKDSAHCLYPFRIDSKDTSSVASFLVLGGQDPEMYRQKKYICTYIARASEASERLRNIYFHDPKYICIVIYNAVSFNYLLYGAINDIILTKH